MPKRDKPPTPREFYATLRAILKAEQETTRRDVIETVRSLPMAALFADKDARARR